jgi:hypothetical protein
VLCDLPTERHEHVVWQVAFHDVDHLHHYLQVANHVITVAIDAIDAWRSVVPSVTPSVPFGLPVCLKSRQRTDSAAFEVQTERVILIDAKQNSARFGATAQAVGGLLPIPVNLGRIQFVSDPATAFLRAAGPTMRMANGGVRELAEMRR